MKNKKPIIEDRFSPRSWSYLIFRTYYNTLLESKNIKGHIGVIDYINSTGSFNVPITELTIKESIAV